MKVLSFGSCNIDYVYSLDHIVRPGETTEAHSVSKYPGGKGLNQSVALARSGAEVYHAGCVGADGEMLRDVLTQSGVNTDYIKEVAEPTGQAIIQVEKSGENCIFLYHGANFCVSKEYIDEVLGNFSAGDILLVQNEINNLPYLVEKGAEKGLKIVLNPSPFNDVIKEVDLAKVWCLILNKTESEGFAEKDFLEIMKEKYPELHIMLTLGKEGSVYQYKEIFVKCPAYSVKAVDTTAAGDTFTGFFISGFAGGDGAEEAVRYASAAAALAVSKNGAASSIPKHAEVLEFIKNHA